MSKIDTDIYVNEEDIGKNLYKKKTYYTLCIEQECLANNQDEADTKLSDCGINHEKVNKELTELISGLIEATKLLSNGGILVVVSFHSLEDRIVKNFFNLYSNLRKNPSRYLPIKVSKSSLFKQISKKPLVANVKEVNENIRSRSAKLRYAIRNNNSFFYPDEFKKKFSDCLTPSSILFLSAPKSTKEHRSISPDIPAICGSITTTID